MKLYMEPFHISQNSWKKTYGHYAERRTDVVDNTSNLPEGVELYVLEEEVPENIRKVLDPHEIPYLSRGSYRFVLAVNHKYSPEIFFWILDSEKGSWISKSRISLLGAPKD